MSGVSADARGTPARVVQGARTSKVALCPHPDCKAARAAGDAAPDGSAAARARAGSRNMIDRARTGVLVCSDCGTSFRTRGVV